MHTYMYHVYTYTHIEREHFLFQEELYENVMLIPPFKFFVGRVDI